MDDFSDEHSPLNLISITINGSEEKSQGNLIQAFAESSSVIPNDIDSSADANLLQSGVSEDSNLLQIETHGESVLLDTEKSSNESNLLQSVASSESTLLSTAVDADRSISTVDNEEVDLFTIQGVENEEFTNHACVNFQEKVYQYLGDGGQVFQTNGYECLQCSQMYTESQLQELAENRQQKPHRQTIDCLPSALGDPSPAAIDLDLTSITQDQQQNIGSTVEMTTSDSTLINSVSSQVSQPHVIMDAGIEGITSVESNDTKFLIGQPRVATGVVEYPQIFTDSNTDLKMNALEKQLETPTIESSTSNQTAEPSDLLVQGDNEIALQMNDITHLIENSEYAEKKTESYSIQANEISSIPADEVIRNKEQNEMQSNDSVNSNFMNKDDDICNDSNRSYIDSCNADQSDNIVVTFSKKKPANSTLVSEKEGNRVGKESETASRNESESGDVTDAAPITDSQQKVLDRLITELEKTSQNPGNQQTKVFCIDELSNDQHSSKSDDEMPVTNLNADSSVEEQSHRETVEKSHTDESSEVLVKGKESEHCDEDSDEGGLDILTDDTEGDVETDSLMKDVQCSNINTETKERMNEMFDAVDSAKSYMNLYEQVEKKGILPALSQSANREPTYESSEEGPQIVSVTSLSEKTTENVETHTKQNLKQAIGRTLYVKTKSSGGNTMKLYQCVQCKVAFSAQSMLESHYKEAHLNTVNKDADSPPSKRIKTGDMVPEVDGRNVYICKCKARFDSTEELEVHLETVDHSELLNKFKCTHKNCDRVFWTYQALSAHMMTHLNRYKDKIDKRPTILIPVEPCVPSADTEQKEDSRQAIDVARKLFSAGHDHVTELNEDANHGSSQVELEEDFTREQQTNFQEKETTEEHILGQHVLHEQHIISTENIMATKPTTSTSETEYRDITEEMQASNSQLESNAGSSEPCIKEVSDAVILEDNGLFMNQVAVLKNNSSTEKNSSTKSQMEKDILSITCIRCNKSYSCAEKWNYKGTLQCSACRWNFESPPHLQCHYDHFHSFDRACPLCDFQSTRCSSSVMDKHFKTVHPNKEIFHCYLCEATFTTRACLRNHVARHFSQTGNYECPHCHMKFEKESRLNIHKVRNHSMLLSIPKGVKTPEQSTLYMCGICGRQYEYEGTLRIHLRKHQTTSGVVEHMDISNIT